MEEMALTYIITRVYKVYRAHGSELDYKQGDADCHDLERAVIPENPRRARQLPSMKDKRLSSHHIYPQQKSTLHRTHLSQTSPAPQVKIDATEIRGQITSHEHDDVTLRCHGSSIQGIRVRNR